MIKEQIIELLKKTLKGLGVVGVEPLIEQPADPGHGDYASNIAMVLFKNQESRIKNQGIKTPLGLAEKIVEHLKLEIRNLNFLGKAEAVPPGFINFWLSKDYLITQLGQVLEEEEKFGTTTNSEFSGKKIMTEFADPNPFKEFHIGHLRNISLGESLSRLLEAQGAKVFRANYQGDVGLHVAKALYGIQSGHLADKVQNVEKMSLEEKVGILGEAYALGSKAYEEDEGAKKKIQELNIKIYQNSPEIRDLWEMGRKWSLEHFEEIYKRLGTKYDYHYFESQTAPVGRQIVLDHLRKGVFERHDGAVIFRGEKHGLHTRVFVTKEDYATYEAKDLALAQLKQKDVSYDRSIIITAHEQAPYFSVILVALKLIASDLAAKTVHYSFGFVSLKTGKMSSRRGDVITAQWLLNEAKGRIKAQFKEMDEETAEKVAVGAVKYSMLKFSPNSDIAFSFDESISLEGNSGPYLQYTHARCRSVLRRAGISNIKYQISNIKLEPEEILVLRLTQRFPEIAREAAEGFAPNIVCNYLFELAQAFNLFYQKHKILPDVILRTKSEESRSFPLRYAQGQDDNTSNFRLSLTASVGQILKNGLYLLGIETPQRM